MVKYTVSSSCPFKNQLPGALSSNGGGQVQTPTVKQARQPVNTKEQIKQKAWEKIWDAFDGSCFIVLQSQPYPIQQKTLFADLVVSSHSFDTNMYQLDKDLGLPQPWTRWGKSERWGQFNRRVFALSCHILPQELVACSVLLPFKECSSRSECSAAWSSEKIEKETRSHYNIRQSYILVLYHTVIFPWFAWDHRDFMWFL